MYKVIILPAALEDVSLAATWYNEKKQGLGKRFSKSLRSELRFVAKNPKASVNRYKNVHTCVMKKFPFMIHYIIEDHPKTIVVLNVLHTAQSPKKWPEK